MSSKKTSWFFDEAINLNGSRATRDERGEGHYHRSAIDSAATRNAIAASMAGAPGAFIGGILGGLFNK